MAGGAGVWDARLLRFFWRDETEGVSTHEVVLDCLLDLGHVARYTLAAGASFRMMRMLAHSALQSRRVIFILRVARKAEGVRGRSEGCCVLVAVNVMAVKAS